MDFEKLVDKDEVLKNMQFMNSLGARLTGNKAHKAFISHLKMQVEALGLKTFEDTYRFDRWEEKRRSIIIDDTEEIKIDSAFPYSGYTSQSGIKGELILVKNNRRGFKKANGKIAVVKIKSRRIPHSIVFNKRAAVPEGIKLPKNYGGAVLTSFINSPKLSEAKRLGVKAVICIWSGEEDEMVEGNYLPFTEDYKDLPALWINHTEGKKIEKAAQNHKLADLILEGELEKNASTETFYTILEGENRKEAIIVNTHTDGTNCVEENGALALIEMIKVLKTMKLKKSIIFVFATGHFRIPSIIQGKGQATKRWLEDHRELWDGIEGHIKAVAGVTLEHLGCSEWGIADGKYTKLNDVDFELCYTGNSIVNEIYLKALEGRKNVRSICLRPHNKIHFGEGQPLFDAGIPDIALVPGPNYLCVVSKSGEIEKFNFELMYEQIITFIKVILMLNGTESSELGESDKYSFLISI